MKNLTNIQDTELQQPQGRSPHTNQRTLSTNKRRARPAVTLQRRAPMRPVRPAPGFPRRRRWLVATALVVIVTTALAVALGRPAWRLTESSAVDLARVRLSLLVRGVNGAMDTAAATVMPAATEAPPLLPEAPWLSPLGLAAPPSTGPASRPHVRVLIRCMAGHAHLARSLLEQFRYQAQQGEDAPATVDFALVATEPSGLNLTRALAVEASVQGNRDTYSVSLSDAFWTEAKQRSAAFACTPAELRQYRREYGQEAMRRICVYENYLYYLATDVGVRDFLQSCPWCTHLLVTNDDNGYHPSFLRRAFSDAGGSGWTAAAAAAAGRAARKWDMWTCDFTTGGQFTSAAWQRGKVDLGGVLATKELVARAGGSFVDALPADAGALEAHDADHHFFQRAMSVGARGRLHHELLFFHN